MTDIAEISADARDDEDVLQAYAKWVFAGHDDDAWELLTENEQELLDWALICAGDEVDEYGNVTYQRWSVR